MMDAQALWDSTDKLAVAAGEAASLGGEALSGGEGPRRPWSSGASPRIQGNSQP